MKTRRKSLSKIALELQKNWPLRRAQGVWAGGEHSVSIKIGKPACVGKSEKVWADNKKWSGNNSEATISVTRSALKHFPNLRTSIRAQGVWGENSPPGSVVSGPVIIDAKTVAHREFKLTWIGQGRGFALKPVNGWLIRGYHSTRKTVEAARTEARMARIRKVAALRSLRGRTLPISKLRTVYVSINDSIEAGNCQTESARYAGVVWKAIGAKAQCSVRADRLLSMRNDSFTRVAVEVAAMRSETK